MTILNAAPTLLAAGAGELTPARAGYLNLLPLLGAGGAGELTPARALLLDYLNATISSRATQAQIIDDTTPFHGASIAAILAAVSPSVVVTGAFTTSSQTIPADNVARIEADHYWQGCVLVPLAGACAFQPALITDFAHAGGVFTLYGTGFTAATGLVAYAIFPAAYYKVLAALLNQTGRIELTKDIWCADSTALATLAFSNVAADKDFPNVVIAAAGSGDGLPIGAVIKKVNLLLIANTLDSSGAANYINAASKTIRVKISTGAWGVDDIIAFTAINGDWYTPASGMAGVTFISGTDISSKVTGAGTYNLESNQTNRADAIVALAASLNLKGVRTGFRVTYTLGT